MIKRVFWLVMLVLIGTQCAAFAIERYRLVSPTGQIIEVNRLNQKREADSLVIFTPAYGSNTKTNPYGVEVAAVKAKGGGYKVTQVTDSQVCTAEDRLQDCGHMPIPKDGVVLSANGAPQTILLEQFTVGSQFDLAPMLTYQTHLPVTITDPTPETNPIGSGFPGYRASNQLIVYTSAFESITTGTNEFGYEVTVKNGRVVEEEGANSLIPQEPGSFVLSGHGKARLWILENAPVGAKIELINGEAVSTIDKETYRFQLDQIVGKIKQLGNLRLPPPLEKQLAAFQSTQFKLSDEEGAKQALALKEAITPYLWASYPSMPVSAMKAAWHRPSEPSLAEIRKSLDMLQKGGFNTVFLETYLHGDPIFPSQTFEAYKIQQKLPFKVSGLKQDLLATWIEEAHKRGIKVHIWFQTFYAGNKQYDKTMGAILSQYPQWANVQRSGQGQKTLPPSTLEPGAYFLDPANQDAQNFLLSLIQEIVSRYDIDGFQLDYIRYPASFPPDKFSYVATTWGYSDTARQIFETHEGVDPLTLDPKVDPDKWQAWKDFKTRQVDRFVQKAHDVIKQEKPKLPLSAAIFPKPTDSVERKHQNWVSWGKAGLLDFIAPMTLTSSLPNIAEDTKTVTRTTGLPAITGIFGPFNGNNASEVVEQAWMAYKNGAQGIIMFDTAHLTPEMAEALSAGLYKTAPKK